MTFDKFSAVSGTSEYIRAHQSTSEDRQSAPEAHQRIARGRQKHIRGHQKTAEIAVFGSELKKWQIAKGKC